MFANFLEHVTIVLIFGFNVFLISKFVIREKVLYFLLIEKMKAKALSFSY